MSFIQATSLSLAFGERDILKSIQINLGPATRAALSGGNGSGKSTLMKILAGKSKADSGKITQSRDARIAYLPQTGITHAGSSVREEMEQAYSYVHNWVDEKSLIEHRLAEAETGDTIVSELLEQQYDLEQKIEHSGYHSRERQISRVLLGLGFETSDFSRDCSEFSGGWQMRIALAVTLLQNPDILLLDEPTNYLDIEAREWLTGFLQSYPGGYLLVSHDRFFLDQTVDEIYEVFNGDLKRYKGSYSDYENRRAVELESLIKLYKKQQDEIEKNEQFIRRFRAQATKASAVQSRVKMLEKIERIELPDNMKKISVSFPDPPRSGDTAIQVAGLSRSYGDQTVFSGLDFHIGRGERVAFTGVNGAGKTTLLKAIAGVDQGWSGEIIPGSGISQGYFAQESSEVLDESLNIEEEIEKDCPTEMVSKIRSLAGAFLFSEDDIYKKVAVLSGGERNRLSLLKLMLQPYNLLILDEPTNHLDLHSKEVLLDALLSFKGTVLFVSHDRYFLDKLAKRVIHLEGGSFRDYPGNYSYYLWKQQQQLESEDGREPEAAENEAESAGKLDHRQQKELRNRIRALEKEEECTLKEIEELEEQLAAVDASLMDPEVYSDARKAAAAAQQKEELSSLIDEKTLKWEQVSEELASTRI